MKYANPDLVFQRNGDVLWRRSRGGVLIGHVESCDLVVHYKTVPDKRRPGYEARTLDGRTRLFWRRRVAGDWLLEQYEEASRSHP